MPYRPEDDVVVQHAQALSVDVYRGDEHDVLDRYYQAATQFQLDVIVRVTSDCPLLDPGLADEVVRPLLTPASHIDYSANTVQRTYPRGLDVQAVPFSTLERAWREATSPHQRQHVFPYVYEHPEKFVTVGLADRIDRSHMRWTVDTADDLAFVREVCRLLGTLEFSWIDVLNVLDRHPEMLRLNAQVLQKSAHDQ